MSPRLPPSPLGDHPIPLGDEAPPHADAPAAPSEALTLAFEDLIPDARGEIVILDQSGQDIAVVSHEAVAAQGVEPAHVMESGFDVSGYAYCTFASGLTVYYPATHRFLVTDENSSG
jgi:hypothetical protein